MVACGASLVQATIEVDEDEPPPSDPIFYLHCADACYDHKGGACFPGHRSGNNQYKNRGYDVDIPEIDGKLAEVLELKVFSTNCGKWRMLLIRKRSVRRPGRTELVVGFQGTDGWLNWVGNAANRFLKSHKKWLVKMDSTLVEWEQKYGKVTCIVGHSAGGFWGTRVLCGRPEIYRITFNADLWVTEETGKRCTSYNDARCIHFRLYDDPVSGWDLPTLGHLEGYIQVLSSQGGHSLRDFTSAFVNATWESLTRATSSRYKHDKRGRQMKPFKATPLEFLYQIGNFPEDQSGGEISLACGVGPWVPETALAESLQETALEERRHGGYFVSYSFTETRTWQNQSGKRYQTKRQYSETASKTPSIIPGLYNRSSMRILRVQSPSELKCSLYPSLPTMTCDL